MRISWLWVIAVSAACGNKSSAPRHDGPLPVTYGDCAGPTIAWVSGPRPASFKDAASAEIRGETTDVAAVAAKPDAPSDSDALPPLPMGDAPPPPDAPDDALAAHRKDAIEQARNAGLVGSTTNAGAFASLTGDGDLSSGFDDSNIYGGLLGNDDTNGGLGYRGTGVGSTGVGTIGAGTIGPGKYGTIGTGKYGTIGHGSGTGGMRGRTTSSMPTIDLGQVNAQGDLDKALIRRYIKRNLAKIRYCYEKELLAKPAIGGLVSVQFFIKPDGVVASSQATGFDPSVSACVAGVIKMIEFPPPKGGGGVQVNYPFTFKPAAGSIAIAAAAPLIDPPKPPPPTPAPTPTPPATPTTPPTGNRQLFRNPGPLDVGYRAGAVNPLRAANKQLTDCFRRTKVPHGVAVVELAYDAAGAVATATVHGIEDRALVACMTAAARRVKRIVPTETVERCSLAYGELPLTAMPTLAITADAITLTGTRLADPKRVMIDTASELKIVEVYDAIRARLATVTSRSAPVVSLHGPLVVHAVNATPMKVVNRVLGSVLAAGDDFVLARDTANGIKLVSPLALPVVPVPFGTGNAWSRVKGQASSWSTRGPTKDRFDLSILVTNDRLFVGLAPLMDFVEIKRDGEGIAKLAVTLADHRSRTVFANRRDIEIAAEDDVIYGDFVAVVNGVVAAGFGDWILATPSTLAARPQR